MSSTVSSSSLHHKGPRILACVLCQHRKIKCDRNPMGCANCAKANIPCTPSTPAPARKRRRPNQDLQERLARCEELLKEYATADAQVQHQPSSVSATTGSVSAPASASSSTPASTSTSTARAAQLAPNSSRKAESHSEWQPTGKLVFEDGAVRFMDSFLLGTVYDELKAMREMVDSADDATPVTATEDNTPADTEATSPDDNADLVMGFPGEVSNSRLADLQPSAAQIFRLWQVFLDRVNPLTKIIHVPTVQPFLAEAASGSLPKNYEPLLFSIYTLATLSLSPSECLTVLGCPRDQALGRFSTGARLALARSNYMISADIVTLQALVLYLISLQGRYNRHAAWILSGTVIRIAQKMGFHRDGEILGLSPFETEMRRRVWWQIISVDGKYALLSGLSHSLLPRNWDTKEPKNINDSDLHPDATEPIRDRDGPTEMILMLCVNKVARFMTQNPSFEPYIMMNEVSTNKDPEGPSTEQIRDYRMVLQQLARDLIDLLEKHCDPSAGKLHQLAMLFKDMILSKLNELLSPNTQLEPGEKPTTRDNAFKVAVRTMEHNVEHYETGAMTGFIWYARLHFQIDVFTFMCGQLCYRTSGYFVERAWELMSTIFEFHEELIDIAHKNIASFVLRAWHIRSRAVAKRTGILPETPWYIQRLRQKMPQLDVLQGGGGGSGGGVRNAGAPGSAGGGAGGSSADLQPDMSPGSATINTTGATPMSSDLMSDVGNAMMDPTMNQAMLSEYLNANSLDWDIWGAFPPTGAPASMAALSGFNMNPPHQDW